MFPWEVEMILDWSGLPGTVKCFEQSWKLDTSLFRFNVCNSHIQVLVPCRAASTYVSIYWLPQESPKQYFFILLLSYISSVTTQPTGEFCHSLLPLYVILLSYVCVTWGSVLIVCSHLTGVAWCTQRPAAIPLWTLLWTTHGIKVSEVSGNSSILVHISTLICVLIHTHSQIYVVIITLIRLGIPSIWCSYQTWCVEIATKVLIISMLCNIILNKNIFIKSSSGVAAQY